MNAAEKLEAAFYLHQSRQLRREQYRAWIVGSGYLGLTGWCFGLALACGCRMMGWM